MSLSQRYVEAALERWRDRGLLEPGLAERLREEARIHEASETRQRARYLVAAVGAFALFLAAWVFSERAWDMLDVGTRTGLLFVAGTAVYLLGSTLEARGRWYPAALLLQAGGLSVLLVAEMYSSNRWANGTAAGIAFGLIGLAVPLAALLRFHGRRAATHALHTGFAFAFAAVFLTRAGDLEGDTVIWILDAMVLGAMAVLAMRIRTLQREDADGTLASLSAALLVGLVLALATGLGPLRLNDAAVLPADAWLALAIAVTLWGIHRAPPALRRGWYETQLSLCVLLGVPLLAFTTMEALDWPVEATALTQAAFGAAALRYGILHGSRGVLLGGAVALATGAWIYGIDRGEALGAVAALVATAALLFWVSTRIRDLGDSPREAVQGAE